MTEPRKPTNPNSPWNDERRDLVKRLWEADMSASAIAARLNCGLTRNAVIGQVHRMKLPKRIRTYLPTPTKSADSKGAPRNRYFGSKTCRSNLREVLRNGPADPIFPHPTFVELVMGFPIGHTDLQPSETP